MTASRRCGRLEFEFADDTGSDDESYDEVGRDRVAPQQQDWGLHHMSANPMARPTSERRHSLKEVTKKVWLTAAGTDLEVTKTEPTSVGLNVAVQVRAADGDIGFDGVWLNGERSYDTYVFIDGEVKYHSPVESDAGRTFELHEEAGGGRLL